MFEPALRSINLEFAHELMKDTLIVLLQQLSIFLIFQLIWLSLNNLIFAEQLMVKCGTLVENHCYKAMLPNLYLKCTQSVTTLKAHVTNNSTNSDRQNSFLASLWRK